MIEIEDVSLTLQERPILRDINLVIPKGGITALVGANGAGKSSLLSLVARLQPLGTGRIRVDGLPVDETPGRKLAKVLAILRQEPGVAIRLRVAELVSFGRFPHHQGRLTPEDLDLVGEALREFQLEDVADRFIDTLSGGQRQRALVAMVFCQGADYMLLDEPLNNLDMYHARELMRTLRRVSDEKGRTVVIVLHDVNHASMHADRIVALKAGRVAATGAPRDVLRTDILEQVFGYRMEVRDIDGHPTVLHHR